MKVADTCNDLGINSYPFQHGLHWLEMLAHEGILGKGKQIETTLDFEAIGSLEFGEQLLEVIAHKKDIGVDLIEGFVPVAHKWGRSDDLKTGKLRFPYWGMPEHGYDPRTEVEWGFATLMTDRDINSHDINPLFWLPNISIAYGMQPRIDAEKIANLVADKLKPYVKGPECVDYSTKNIYSDEVLNLTRWFIHYGRFWKNSALFCDLRWADLFDTNAPGDIGATGDPDVGEQVYWNAVTGENIAFLDGLEKGYRIFMLDRAIWALQGRHRDQEVFSDYIYETINEDAEFFPFYFWPATDEHGIWEYRDILRRSLDREKMEEWKTRFYQAEGLDPKTGRPTRTTLEKLGMSEIADALESAGKLGKEA
jgi:aldehyde:ferredoxin oxidoreductase